jgi:hypothetical protein
LSPEEALQKLPVNGNGHSFLELANVLQSMGLSSHGSRESLARVEVGETPVIIQLTRPPHFVVASQAASGSLLFLDGGGYRSTLRYADVRERWTGNVLHVTKSPANDPRVAPKVDFCRLDHYRGSIPDGASVVVHDYPFRNVGGDGLIIHSVECDSRCLVSDFPREPIPSGGSGVVRLAYGLCDHDTRYELTAVVTTNDPTRTRPCGHCRWRDGRESA